MDRIYFFMIVLMNRQRLIAHSHRNRCHPAVFGQFSFRDISMHRQAC